MSTMSKNKKMKGNLVLDFSSLPQRVIVHEILSSVVVSPSAKAIKKDFYVCFGYFRRDRLRNIWFVFPSIKIQNTLSFFIRSSKLFCLHLQDVDNILFPKIMEERKNFVILEQIEFLGNYTYPHNIVSTELDLPRVNKLTISSKDNSLSCEKFHPKFYERLDYLHLIYTTPPQLESKFLKSCQNLRKLYLTNINFQGTSTLKFPHLESLYLFNISSKNQFIVPKVQTLLLEGDEKLDLKTGPALRLFDATQFYDIDTMKHVFINSPNIEEFRMYFEVDSGMSQIFCEWFFESEENQSCNLKKLVVPLHPDEDYEIKKKIILDTSHLEKLTLLSSEQIEDNFFSLDLKYPVLKELVFQCIHIPHVKENMLWVFSNHLEKLTLHTLVFENGDILFRRNRFTALKKLTMFDISGFYGKKYHQMPNLEKLRIHQVDDFTDDFFKEQELTKLKKLEISSICNMNGRGYHNKVFKSLESLKIVYTPKLNDDFFSDSRFPVLQDLRIRECRFLTGNNWNNFESLKKLKILKCSSFGNKCFSNGVFTELEYLYISRDNQTTCKIGFYYPVYANESSYSWKIPNLKVFGMGPDMENEFENGFIKWLKDTKGCEIRRDTHDLVDGEVFYYEGEPLHEPVNKFVL